MNIDQGKDFGINIELIEKLKERGLTDFTSAQQAALEAGLANGNNLFISAPTSGGKTTIAEIAAVKTALRGGKSVYLLSHKALAEEKYRQFREWYAHEDDPWFDVCISTGDRVEGVWKTGILIATYEKFLSLTSASEDYTIDGALIIADEIQLISDKTRGADVEILCTKIKLGKPSQIIALSATIANSNSIAEWLGCREVKITERDVPLKQQIWYQGKACECKFGSDDVIDIDETVPIDTISACHHLLNKGFSPILVFTMTRPQAVKLAQSFSESIAKKPSGFGFSEQLDFFSEPLTLSRTLSMISEKRIAFHTADLSLVERELIENGLLNDAFDIVFATPTLAAGVNFPFKTVVFDSFSRPWASDNQWLPKGEYQNMSGRAGRLGMHNEGYSILLPSNRAEQIKANELIISDQESIKSKLIERSLRKLILGLVASRVARSAEEIIRFFENTYWTYEQSDANIERLSRLPEKINLAIEWLMENGFIINDREIFSASDFGYATARAGLLPSTALSIIGVVCENLNRLNENCDDWICAFLHAICASDEFNEDGQRYLPYSARNNAERIAISSLTNANLFLNLYASNAHDRVINATYGLTRWIEGVDERTLKHEIPPITYGYMQKLADDVTWILSGISIILRSPSLEIPEKIISDIDILKERVLYGVPSLLIDLMRIAKDASVPGFGRHRAMSLYKAGYSDSNKFHSIDREKLEKILENPKRLDALLNAIATYLDRPLDIWKLNHTRRASAIGLDEKIIKDSYDVTGDYYEEPVEKLLKVISEWNAEKLDKNKRQGVPDFQIIHKNKSIVLECKTKQKNTALVSKDDAFAVLTKAVDIECDAYVTLGKPDFDTFSREKAGGSKNTSLISHIVFVEAILQYAEGKFKHDALFDWLIKPGYKSLDSLNLAIILAKNK